MTETAKLNLEEEVMNFAASADLETRGCDLWEHL